MMQTFENPTALDADVKPSADTKQAVTAGGVESLPYSRRFAKKWAASIGASPDSSQCCRIYLTCAIGYAMVRSGFSALHQFTQQRLSQLDAEPCALFDMWPCCPSILITRCHMRDLV